MRSLVNPMICISIAVLAAGCSHTNIAPTAASVAARAAAVQSAQVDTGAISFDQGISYKTIDILGVGDTYAQALADQGITKVDELLMAGASRTGRAHLVAATGISEKLIMTWINHCDLMRVMGCGPEYARLLELANVNTVPQLAERNALSLAAAVVKANSLGGGKVAVHRLPDVTTTAKWIANAKSFQRIVTY